jgi:hypothetical protein
MAEQEKNESAQQVTNIDLAEWIKEMERESEKAARPPPEETPHPQQPEARKDRASPERP